MIKGKQDTHLHSSAPTRGYVSCSCPANSMTTRWRTSRLRLFKALGYRLAEVAACQAQALEVPRSSQLCPVPQVSTQKSLTLCKLLTWLPPSGNTGPKRDCDLDIRVDFFLATKTL